MTTVIVRSNKTIIFEKITVHNAPWWHVHVWHIHHATLEHTYYDCRCGGKKAQRCTPGKMPMDYRWVGVETDDA